MDVETRHNIKISGSADGQPMLFAHGFGCDQHMWRDVAPSFDDEFRVITFDHVGAGGTDPSDYDADRYSSLQGYADDVLRICHELELSDVVFVGHSVSSIIGVLAEVAEPSLFDKLVLVSPSPRYTDDPPYVGGFTQQDITELLESLDSNYLGWSSAIAPVIMGNAERPALGQELTASFCRADPDIARRFAHVTFTSDNRADLALVSTPTLVLQCAEDVIAPVEVGRFVRDTIPGATLTMLEATGHCPNLSAPAETTRAIDAFVRKGEQP